MKTNTYFKYSVLIIGLGCIVFSFQNCAEPNLSTPPPRPKTVSLKLQNYCPVSGSRFKEIFLHNKSALIEKDYFVADFDRDGLSDDIEFDQDLKEEYDISANLEDTNGDYYKDLINIRLGFNVANQSRLTPCDNYNDTDLDGLTDCEENALRINPLNPDTDADGIPDGLEIRNHLNPNDNVDARADIDQDGLSNLEEVKAGSPMKISNNKYVQLMMLRYFSDTTANEDGSFCYDVDIDNVPILNVANGNHIQAYITEDYTFVSGGQTQEAVKLRQINIIIDQLVVADSVIAINVDNNVSKQTEVVNLGN